MRFQDLLGQTQAIDKVRDAISQERLPHALMLTGPEGVGKLAFAHALIQYVNCLQPKDGDSCGKCSNCIKIQKCIHPDLHYILPIISKKSDGKQQLTKDLLDQFRPLFLNDPYMSFSQWQSALGGESKQLMVSVHEIRELKRNIYLKSFEAPTKMVIIWQAERINVQGANAFLKLLEEPPGKTLIVMTCSDTSRLLSTIRSRCQQLRLQRVPGETISQYLTEKYEISTEDAETIASISEGSPGNAGQFLAESQNTIEQLYAEWLRAIYRGNFAGIQSKIEPIYQASKEFQRLFLSVALKKIRNALLFHLELYDIALLTPAEQSYQANFAQLVTPTKVEHIARALEESQRYIAGNANAQMVYTSLSLNMHRILHST